MAKCDPAYVQQLSKHHFWHFQPHKPTKRGLNRITTLSREYPIKCNSNLFIHRSIIEKLMTQNRCYQMISVKNHYFYHYLFSAIEEIFTTTINDYI